MNSITRIFNTFFVKKTVVKEQGEKSSQNQMFSGMNNIIKVLCN